MPFTPGIPLRALSLAGMVALPLSASVGLAQTPTRLTPEQFRTSPARILEIFPNGGAEMISLVRELTLADPADLPLIVNLLSNANDSQGTAIGTGLGQAALASVKTNQAYAADIQRAVVDKAGSPSNSGPGSSQPKIGSAVTTLNQVEGVTDKGTAQVATGSQIFLNEIVRTSDSGKAQMLFADHTNVALAPATEVRLDKFAYDPSQSRTGGMELVVNRGAFRFITGLQPHEAYAIKTPYATMRVRGTEFIVNITQSGVQIQLISGALQVTTSSGKVVDLSVPAPGQYMNVSIDSQGNAQGPTPASQPLVNFAELGPPVTNLSFADALAAFSAVTGDVGTASTGGGGGGGAGGGGGSVAAFGGGFSGGGGGATPNFNTFVLTTPTNFFALDFTSSGATPGSVTDVAAAVSAR
jgi:hypothetical protein